MMANKLGFAIWVHRVPLVHAAEWRRDTLSTHAAHSQPVTLLILVVPASLIPHPPRVCRPWPPSAETLPPASILLFAWAVRSITSDATRVARCARGSAERGSEESDGL